MSVRIDRWRKVLGTALLTGMVLGSGLGAQPAADEDASRHGIFIETLDVTLVNVEVVVTENGRPVTDLTRDDFEVFDDGEPVAITNFHRVENGRRVAPAGDGEPAPQPVPLANEHSAVIVLVDNAFLSPTSRRAVFDALAQRLDGLIERGAQVMVASKDQAIKIEQRFTRDRREVDAVLDRLSRRAGSGNLDDSTEGRIVREVELGASPGTVGPGGLDLGEADAVATYSRAQTFAAEIFQKVRRSSVVTRGFLGSLAGLPGRKVLLYVADRLPLRPGELPLSVWAAKYARAYGDQVGFTTVQDVIDEFDTSQELLELIADASASGVVFYPIGNGRNAAMRAISAANDSAVGTASFALQNVTQENQGLRFLARGTGGEAAVDVSSTDWLLDRLESDVSAYYSLGYPAPHGGDGKTHRIKVRVKRPGVEVRYLETYRAKTADQQMSDRTVAALFFDAGDNPLDVRLLLGDAERQKDGTYLQPIEIRFPIANLVLLPEADNHSGNVSIFVVVRDDKGRMSPPTKVPVPVTIPNANMLAAMSQIASYRTNLRMRRGEQSIAVSVRDDLAAKSSTVGTRVRLGKAKGKG
ncbi:MAG: VWA domain-containing protein [Acidobacteria bacterium]|nr:MAG: VWA domain-containing protein [Acidobacteriota bacterium]